MTIDVGLQSEWQLFLACRVQIAAYFQNVIEFCHRFIVKAKFYQKNACISYENSHRFGIQPSILGAKIR